MLTKLAAAGAETLIFWMSYIPFVLYPDRAL